MSRVSKSSASKSSARRRAAQACGTCRARKVRCDASIPKCGLCDSLHVECVYLEPEIRRIDPSTRLLLDRIQKLEDRIFASPKPSANLPGAESFQSPNITSPRKTQNDFVGTPGSTAAIRDFGASEGESLTLPPMHDANTNNVYQWTIVQSLLSGDASGYNNSESTSTASLPEATDILIMSDSKTLPVLDITSWHLFGDLVRGQQEASASQLEQLKDLIDEYFLNVQVFYPILSQSEIYEMLQIVADSEIHRTYQAKRLDMTRYCLLLIVLCLGSVARERNNLVYSSNPRKSTSSLQNSRQPIQDSQDLFWAKARLLLGTVSFDSSTEAAQCFVLSSIYLGSKGKTLESHQQIHIAAGKVGVLAKRTILQFQGNPTFSDSFCRLFWVVYVLESDFAMELTLFPPSGITRFEEMVQYPTSEQTRPDFDQNMDTASPSSYLETIPSTSVADMNIAAFQISTNSAIRRFLNRITAVIYNPHELWRKRDHASYVIWLLKITNELQSHHEAIHNNLPPFLLSTDESMFGQHGRSTASGAEHQKYTNHLWNVSRLRGRYCAGEYLICRASFEFVLLNPDAVHGPSGEELLRKCRSCINACVEFVRVFSVQPANSMTNLFATGMATFGMVIILMISTTSIQFQQIMPSDIEDVITMGKQNLQRFSLSVTEFEWHLKELQKLDYFRKAKV